MIYINSVHNLLVYTLYIVISLTKFHTTIEKNFTLKNFFFGSKEKKIISSKTENVSV